MLPASLLEVRQGRFLPRFPDVSTAQHAIQLWSSETKVRYSPRHGDRMLPPVTQPRTSSFAEDCPQRWTRLSRKNHWRKATKFFENGLKNGQKCCF